MAHPATAVYVMIASPSDVPEARDAVHRALSRWNEANTKSLGVALIPLRWETSTVPLLGGSPQAIINKQLVEQADIVIALFGSRLGTVTPDDVSGTAEEISVAEQSGKPIHLYFSTAPHANDVEPEQLMALQQFKKELQSRGLYGTFNSPDELLAHVWQAIGHDVQSLSITDGSNREASTGVDFLAQPGFERYVHSTDPKGRIKYRTRRWVDVTNRGAADAQEVTFSAPDGVFLGLEGPTTIHEGQTRHIPMSFTYGASEDVILRVEWVEGGEQQAAEFHIG